MSEKKSKTIFKATATNYLRQVVQIVSFLFLTPFIIHAVGKEQFGLWSLIQATVGLLGLMDLGLSTSVVKYVADARGRKDDDRVGHITATLFWVYTVMGTLVAIVAMAVAPWLPKAFGLAGADADVAPKLMFLVALRSAQALPLGMFVGILVAYQRQVFSNAIRIFGTVSYALTAWYVLKHNPSLEALGWVTLLTGLLANVIALVVCLLQLPAVRVSPRWFQRSMIREVSTFSTWFFLIQISLLLATRVDLMTIKVFLPLSAAAYYAVAMRVTEQASVLCRQFSGALTPMIAELKGAGEDRNLRVVFRRGGQIAFAMAAPVLGGLMMLSSSVIRAWLGPNYDEAIVPMQLLLAAALVGTAHTNAENMLSMTGHQKFLAIGMVGSQILNLLLTVALIQHLGISGSSLATLLATLFLQVGLVARRACTTYEVSLWDYYRTVVGPSVPGLIGMGAFLWLGQRLLGTPHLLSVVVLQSCGMAVFFLLFLYVGLSADDREYYVSRVRGMIRKRTKSGTAGAGA